MLPAGHVNTCLTGLVDGTDFDTGQACSWLIAPHLAMLPTCRRHASLLRRLPVVLPHSHTGSAGVLPTDCTCTTESKTFGVGKSRVLTSMPQSSLLLPLPAWHTASLLSCALQAAKKGIRDSWSSWNPQRKAAHELQQRVQSGQISLQDTILAQRQVAAHSKQDPAASSTPVADAKGRGWVTHPKAFAWPAAKDAQVGSGYLHVVDYRLSTGHCFCGYGKKC